MKAKARTEDELRLLRSGAATAGPSSSKPDVMEPKKVVVEPKKAK